MPIVVTLADVMKSRGVRLNELARQVGITNVNLSRVKTGKIKAARFLTLDSLCEVLGCQPGDLLKHVSEQERERPEGAGRKDPAPSSRPRGIAG